jgi:hypothetical protein
MRLLDVIEDRVIVIVVPKAYVVKPPIHQFEERNTNSTSIVRLRFLNLNEA